jgi:NADH dehydrogenase
VHCIGISREHGEDTFKRTNGDAAIVVGEAARAAGVVTFVFLSAAEKPPWAHEEYLSSKRRAEVVLAKTGMRVVIMRPGLVYGSERPLSVLAARLLKAARALTANALVQANAPIRVRMLAKAIQIERAHFVRVAR